MPEEGPDCWKWLEPHLNATQYAQTLELRRRISEALANNVMPHFTDHSVKHCDRVIDIVGRLVAANLAQKDAKTLTDDELFILAAAVLFHDVGMQVPKAHGIDTPISELTREELQTIRREHGVVSGLLLRKIVDDEGDLLHVGITEHYVKRRLPHVASLCENHQSSARYDPSEETPVGANKVRIGLLTGLLRLADQLDCDGRRVDLDKLDHFSIPLDSIKHWLICSYIDAVSIENGFVEVLASFPTDLAGPEVGYLSRLFLDKLWTEYRIAEKCLWQNDVKLRLPERVTRTGTDFSHKKLPLPKEILEQIRADLAVDQSASVQIAEEPKVTPQETDWMTYWKVIGNPFLDRPVSYGSDKFVATGSMKEMLAEIASFLQGPEGELKLLIGERGMGKTTLFYSIEAKCSGNYSAYVVDIADKIGDVRSAADLKNLIFYSIHNRISIFPPTGKTEDVVEAARLGKKKVICVDSLDRLPEDKDSLVVDFLKSAQMVLSQLRTVSVVVFACAERWSRFLTSDELSYLGYKNKWQLEPFTSDDIVEMLDKRLRASGSSFGAIFDSGCAGVLRTLSRGNPRLVLANAEAICRLGAQQHQTKIVPKFIREEYEKDFDEALQKMVVKLVDASPDFKKAVLSLYHYYLEMERRGLDTNQGWNYVVELLGPGLDPERVLGSYRTVLRFLSRASGGVESPGAKPATLVPFPFLRALFRELKKEGYSVRDFLTFYSVNPVAPGAVDDDLETQFKSPLLIGPDVDYFEKSRQRFIETKRSTAAPFQIISDSWDCIQGLMYAILLKAGIEDVNKLIAKEDEWFAEDRYGVRRYVRGAGKLRAEHAKELSSLFVTYLKERKTWMGTLASLFWIRDQRANVVKGRTEYLTQFGARERDLCLRHLDAVYKELSKIYG